jgi:hypothetical protein
MHNFRDLVAGLCYIETLQNLLCFCGPGSSVGIANGYGLEGLRIESRWGQDFSHVSRPALGPTQHSAQWVPGLFQG